MKPYIHAELSVRKYGGKLQDYIPIHDFFDQTKAHHADMRHRMILHNAWGIFMCEKQFGTFITNSDGNHVQVRDIGEDHVLQDLGRIPSLSECIQQVPLTNIGFFSRPNEVKKSSLEELLKRTQNSPEARRVIDGGSRNRFGLDTRPPGNVPEPEPESVVVNPPEDDDIFYDAGKPDFTLPELEPEATEREPLPGEVEHEVGMPGVEDTGLSPEDIVADSGGALIREQNEPKPGRFDRGPDGDIILD